MNTCLTKQISHSIKFKTRNLSLKRMNFSKKKIHKCFTNFEISLSYDEIFIYNINHRNTTFVFEKLLVQRKTFKVYK